MFCRSLSLSRHRRNIQHVIICCRRRSRRVSMYDGIYACMYVLCTDVWMGIIERPGNMFFSFFQPFDVVFLLLLLLLL